MKYLKHLLIPVCLLMACPAIVKAEQVEWEVLQTEKLENPPERVTLEHKFDTSKVRKYEMTAAGEGSLKLPGEPEKTKLQTNTKLTFIQQAAEEKGVENSWRVGWKLESGTMKVPNFHESAVSMAPLEVVMDKYGAVKEIKGLEKLRESSGLPSTSPLPDIISQLKSVGFPGRPLKKSDLWEREYKVEIPGKDPVTINVTSQLMDFIRLEKTDCARVRTTYETPLKFSVDGSNYLDGTEKGEFWTYFAYNEGKIVQCHGNLILTANVLKEPLKTDEGQDTKPGEYNLDIKYHVVMKLLGEEPKPAGKEVRK